METTAANLPDAVLQLTYGDDWPQVIAYFRTLAETLPLRETVHLRTRPKVLPAEEPWQETADFWNDNTRWQAILDPTDKNIYASLQQLTQRYTRGGYRKAAPHVEEYLRLLPDLVPGPAVDLVYQLIGQLETETARELLLELLELPGRHPHTIGLLKGLRPYRDADTQQRLLALYPRKQFTEHRLEEYLRLLRNFTDPEVESLALKIMGEHPGYLAKIANVLGANGYTPTDVARVVREQFEREEDYYFLDRILGFLNALNVPEHSVDLAAMNRRAADPAFIDTAPVTWPQQLEPNWRQILLTTPESQLFLLVNDYLSRPEPRLQRNGLLQLETYLSERNYEVHLPPETEDHLRKLLSSRFEKVSTVALRTVGKIKMDFYAPEAMLDAILEHSLRTNYPLVVLHALRNTDASETAKRKGESFYTVAISAAKTEEDLSRIRRLLPFVGKYLGDATTLREQLVSTRLAT